MKYQLDSTGINKLKHFLAQKLEKGCQLGANELQNYTPIDTKRLYVSTRATNWKINDRSITCSIKAGGEKLPGITREMDISREVDYAIFVEVRTGYISENLGAISNAIVEGLTN